MRTQELVSSTCAPVNNVAGGRKTIIESIIDSADAPVIVNVSDDDAIFFSDEFESVPSLDSESDDDETEEEEESDDDDDDAELDEGLAERLRILADARALKNLAVAFLHPEKPVREDGAVFGRNYFDRPSAPERMEDDEADEVAEILEDARKLKKAAMAYLHPEEGVKVEDVTLFGRNYFDRPSAPEVEDAGVAQERALVLADALALKHTAKSYLHPEVGVKSADGACFGRNYFTRYSAPEMEDDEFADERAEILADAAALKKAAMDYMHPEVGVSAQDATLFGRNYFTRYSAPDVEDADEANERAQILADALALKKYASAYSHPEVGVRSTDGACFGRNYFTRYSAPTIPVKEAAPEQGITADLSRLAAAVKEANLPSTKSTKFSSTDTSLGVAKKSASTVNLFGLSEEVM
ncbi:hypothetical protein ACHAW6_001303 [Cyclotella cf. meneghiniana]